MENASGEDRATERNPPPVEGTPGMQVMTASPIQAVLFDVDGTLLDTTEFIYQGFVHTLAHHGHQPRTREELGAIMGQGLDRCYAALAPGDDPAVLVETHRSWQGENLHLSVSFPGVEDALSRLRDAGMRLAAITNRSRRTSVVTLERAGLVHYFAVVLSFEDMPRAKPEPDGLLIALERLGVAAEYAVMVGDTDNDILAGKAAGMRTVGVSYGFHGHAITDHNPDVVVHALTEIPAALGVRQIG